MSDKEPKCKPKQRLKGVENFLRRMAFNLGNSPSQTEVKIISCIPIDVTDLQKKIVSLEKQLDDAKKSPVNATIATARQEYRPELSAQRTSYYDYGTNEIDHSKEMINSHELWCDRTDRSKLVHVCPTISIISKKSFNNEHNNNMEVYLNENKEGVFNKIKKKKDLKKNENVKTQLVYYAQTVDTPFNNYNVNIKPRTKSINDNSNSNNPSYVEQMIWGKYEQRPILDEFTDESDFALQVNSNKNYNERNDSRSYFEQMIRRQYEPRPVLDEFSNGSTFSSPVCKDNKQNHKDLPVKIDSYSCCYNKFQNASNPDRSTNDPPPRRAFEGNLSERSIFYDTSHYDMIPVKEISTKVRKNGKQSKRKQKKTGLNICSSGTKTITKNHSLIINYHTLAPTKVKNSKIVPTKITNKPEINKIIRGRHVATATSVEPIELDTSNCCIDFGNVYMKQTHNKFKSNKMVQTRKSLHLLKDIECMATNILNTECQTVATQSIRIDEHKTEQTLDQIKSILQSVLTEVKTNAQQKILPLDKDTKDAVVQKGMSRGNMPGCSDLLRSCTYSSCNMNFHSSQLNSRHYCANLPYNPMKCLHNFPVFIQSPNRKMCSSCYGYNSSHFTKAGCHRPAITAATNTDENKEHNMETEKLIKEIYKSIALNYDVPTKDTSMSENDDLESTLRPTSKSSKEKYDHKLGNSTGVSIKSMPHTNIVRNTSIVTPISTNTFNSNQASNTVTTQSQIASSTETDRHLRSDRIQKFVQNKRSRQSMRRVSEEYEQPNDNTAISEYTESSEDETEQDTGDQQPTKPNKEKGNIFTKMFKSVKLFKNKNKQEQISEYDEDDNDSDYQTIYSQKIDTVRHLPTQNICRKLPHSKISYSRQMRERHPEKRMSYLENRRKESERPTYNYDQPTYISGQPYSMDTSRRKNSQAYWQDYETRNVMIEQNEPTHSVDYNERYIDSSSDSKYVNVPRTAPKGLTWLKKHKLGIHCGEQWKKLILEG